MNAKNILVSLFMMLGTATCKPNTKYKDISVGEIGLSASCLFSNKSETIFADSINIRYLNLIDSGFSWIGCVDIGTIFNANRFFAEIFPIYIDGRVINAFINFRISFGTTYKIFENDFLHGKNKYTTMMFVGLSNRNAIMQNIAGNKLTVRAPKPSTDSYHLKIDSYKNWDMRNGLESMLYVIGDKFFAAASFALLFSYNVYDDLYVYNDKGFNNIRREGQEANPACEISLKYLRYGNNGTVVSFETKCLAHYTEIRIIYSSYDLRQDAYLPSSILQKSQHGTIDFDYVVQAKFSISLSLVKSWH